jgi:hypothetical protein
MSGYADIRSLGLQCRPIERWPGELTKSRKPSPFSASWTSTVELLGDELRHIRARQIVMQFAIDETDFRNDGLPRANAKAAHPGVILSFTEGRNGQPLQFAVDRFDAPYWRGSREGWQQNVRAIALGLEALRKVDRYGITRHGEQYTGWKQLPASTDPADQIVTRAQAEEIIRHFGGNGDVTAALRATHPDHGGNPDDFRQVMRAKEILA